MEGDIVLQSFFAYSMDFAVADGIIKMPAVSAKPKNVIVMSKEHFEQIMLDVTFSGMIDQKLYRKLDSVPSSYYDSMEQVSRANQKLAETKMEVENAKADAGTARATAERLQKQLDEMGGATRSTDAKVLEAEAERDNARKEADEANAMIASLKAKLAKKKD